MQTEAEALAAELDAAAEEGLDPATLQEIEDSVETAAEALLTMREAKTRLQEVKKGRGYGKTDGSDKKGTAAKKQSGKHPCFDCGLPGHWAGDPECQKPGQNLGRKSPPKKAKQVKVVETLNTEHVVEELDTQTNEALAVVSEPGLISDSLVQAVSDAHGLREVKAMSPAILACDKRLVGALDSACNRTCTGPEWLKGFLAGLKDAPQEIQDLVVSRPEREVFRFGNGGTQTSEERWRLPAVVGGELICFWTSLVPVPSLGLLLGRDFLEAVGADMSFARRILMCEHLNSVPIPLHQLTAGHYLLHLLPSSWPGVVSQKRWKRLGVDGVLELQLSMKDWLNKRFGGGVSRAVRAHDHLLTEHSLQAGRMVLAQASMTSAPVLKPNSTSAPTTSPSASSQPVNGEPVSSFGMETTGASQSRAKRVGRKRSSAVAAPKALAALLALAVSMNHYSAAVEGASPQAGHGWNHPKAALEEGGVGSDLQHAEPWELQPFARPAGSGSVFHGRPQGGRDAVWPSRERPGGQVEETGPGRGLGSREGGRGSWQSRARSTIHDWTKGRLTDPAWRSSAPGGAAACEGGGWRHGDPAEREDQTDCGLAQGEARTESESQKQGPSSWSNSQISPTSCDVLVSEHERSAFDSHRRPTAATRRHGGSSGPRDFCSSAAHGGARVGGSGGGRDDFRTRVDSLRDCAVECRRLRRAVQGQVDGPVWRGKADRPDQRRDRASNGSLEDPPNPFVLDQKLKRNQAQLIAQAWKRHEEDRRKVSLGPSQLKEILVAQHEQEFRHFMNDETFFQSVILDPAPKEVFENVAAPGYVKAPANAQVSERSQAFVSKDPLVSEV